LQQGRLMGVFTSLDSYPSNAQPKEAPMEGNFNLYLDGSSTAQFSSTGYEDFYLFDQYFQMFNTEVGGQNCFDQGYSGLQFHGNYTWNGYRWFIMDPINFQNALHLTWNCGDTSQANFTGGVRFSWCVWYYTE